SRPWSGVSQGPGGSLYGSTLFGGIPSIAGGSLFKLNTDGSGWLDPLYSFTQQADGGQPYSAPLDGGDGFLYGVAPLYGSTSHGSGSYGAGVVYRIAIDGTGYNVLHVFNGSDGSQPVGDLI